MHKTIVNMKFGSHLYGTDTPESDTDYKGIFLPCKRDILLNRVSKVLNLGSKKDNTKKNTKDDIDCDFFSLYYFIKLACEGQTVAIDMLHAPEEMILEQSNIWKTIVKERKRFYTKNLNAFSGYARKQAAKYGIKRSRLNILKDFISFLKSKPGQCKLGSFWNEFPIGEYSSFLPKNKNGIAQYNICGRTLQETQKVDYTLDILTRIYTAYGERVNRAARNEGIDWKAVSHAVRAAYQLIELYKTGTITFPLKEAKLIKAIKQGEKNYLTEVAPLLESLMEGVGYLSGISSFPEKVDTEFWDNFIINVLNEYLNFM